MANEIVKDNDVSQQKGIVYIGIEHIHPHPENPRKDLGDLSELADSLKKNGCLQNLTVVPAEDKTGEFYALIGNRRHRAASLAGLTELPCRIVSDMDRRTQISTMLEENMQRSDLTVVEQAQGFQLMLDLGETEESIAEKTGFSRTTIRHRLNIAKLDQEELKSKEESGDFQLTLKDLYELEKVKSIKKRNEILKNSRDSKDLVWKAQSAATKEKQEKNKKAYAKKLKKIGIGPAPENASQEQYSGKWKTVKEYDLCEEPPKDIEIPETDGKIFYLEWFGNMRLIVKAPKEKRELSEWEIAEKERKSKKKQIKDIIRGCNKRRKRFVLNIISGKISPIKDEEKVKDQVFESLLELGTYLTDRNIWTFFLEKDEYSCSDEEKKEAREKAGKISLLHKMLIALHNSMAHQPDIFDYRVKYEEEKASVIVKAYKILEKYGWCFEDDDERQVFDGTHELYTPDDNKDKNVEESDVDECESESIDDWSEPKEETV